MKQTDHSASPLSLRLFLVSLVMSGAAGHDVWLTLPSNDPPLTPAFSCDNVFSRRDGLLPSLDSESSAIGDPSAPPSSRGNKLQEERKQDWFWLIMIDINNKQVDDSSCLVFKHLSFTKYLCWNF